MTTPSPVCRRAAADVADRTAPKPPAPTVLKVLLWVGLALLLLAIVLMGTCTYCVMNNPEARKLGALVGESVRAGLASTRAPGTDELRAVRLR